MRRRSHIHRCSNHDRGCPSTYTCYLPPIIDDCGKYCEEDLRENTCELCIEADSCEDCGAFLNHDELIEAHHDDCALSPAQRDDSLAAKREPGGDFEGVFENVA